MKTIDAVATTGGAEWLTGRQAARLCRQNSYTIVKLALLGRIRTRIEPGMPIRYCLEDVLKIAAGE